MSDDYTYIAEADREKRIAALSSVGAALLLTGLKLGVGFATNSLGILSEAAHSGLDLVAAVVTYWAVRAASRPADADHPYGHGKVENLSALVETLLLLLTCGWIVREAVDRLFFEAVHVEPSVWGLAVMGVSIVVDISRARMLRRVARKHNSQALEADALHFSTDVWSSAVVIAGLLALRAAMFFPQDSFMFAVLQRADAFAALVVSCIVVFVSLQLGRRAVDVLLDGGAQEQVERAADALKDLPGIVRIERLRVRQSGPRTFVDLLLCVPQGMSFEASHTLSEQAERRLHAVLPQADVIVHMEPASPDEVGMLERIRGVAASHGLAVHAVSFMLVDGEQHVDLHAEVAGEERLEVAHERVSAFEADLARTLGKATVVTHIEPVAVREDALPEASNEALTAVEGVVHSLLDAEPDVDDCHNMRLHRLGDELSLSFHCRMSPETPVSVAHEAATRLEKSLRARLGDISRVAIHMEPTPRNHQA